MRVLRPGVVRLERKLTGLGCVGDWMRLRFISSLIVLVALSITADAWGQCVDGVCLAAQDAALGRAGGEFRKVDPGIGTTARQGGAVGAAASNALLNGSGWPANCSNGQCNAPRSGGECQGGTCSRRPAQTCRGGTCSGAPSLHNTQFSQLTCSTCSKPGQPLNRINTPLGGLLQSGLPAFGQGLLGGLISRVPGLGMGLGFGGIMPGVGNFLPGGFAIPGLGLLPINPNLGLPNFGGFPGFGAGLPNLQQIGAGYLAGLIGQAQGLRLGLGGMLPGFGSLLPGAFNVPGLGVVLMNPNFRPPGLIGIVPIGGLPVLVNIGNNKNTEPPAAKPNSPTPPVPASQTAAPAQSTPQSAPSGTNSSVSAASFSNSGSVIDAF